jgi:hypothetical protein
MIKIFLKQKIKKLAKNYVRAKRFRTFENIHEIIVFFNIENLPEVERFVETLIQHGKKVRAYSLDKKKNKHKLSAVYHILTKDVFELNGIPKKRELLAFTKESADTLIDLTKNPSPVFQYFFLNAHADFRIGFNKENAALYDLLIECNQEHEFSFFLAQMLFYMKSLRTK